MEITVMICTGNPEATKTTVTVVCKNGLCVIGRSDANIIVPDIMCSNRHAVLYLGPKGELRIRDLGSRNGTVVGNYSILDAKLEAGEKVFIGASSLVVLRHTLSAKEPPPPVRPPEKQGEEATVIFRPAQKAAR